MIEPRPALTIAAVCLMAGFGLGRWKPQAKTEPPAQAIIHRDGSRTLERTAEPPPAPLPEPPGTIARTRAAIVELGPIPTRSQIQIDLVTLADGTQRITAKGPGITGGKDYPIGPPATVHKWTVAGAWDGNQWTAIVLRSRGNLSIGAMAGKNEVRVIVGFSF